VSDFKLTFVAHRRSKAVMHAHELKERTFRFGVRIVRLCEALPENRTGRTIANQLVRCGTSVGANYRAAARAKSNRDFIAKMGIVEEECDEAVYWIEMAVATGTAKQELVNDLLDEAGQLLAITVTSIRTAKAKERAEAETRKNS
jgi:four helix bundle protein